MTSLHALTGQGYNKVQAFQKKKYSTAVRQSLGAGRSFVVYPTDNKQRPRTGQESEFFPLTPPVALFGSLPAKHMGVACVNTATRLYDGPATGGEKPREML